MRAAPPVDALALGTEQDPQQRVQRQRHVQLPSRCLDPAVLGGMYGQTEDYDTIDLVQAPQIGDGNEGAQSRAAEGAPVGGCEPRSIQAWRGGEGRGVHNLIWHLKCPSHFVPAVRVAAEILKGPAEFRDLNRPIQSDTRPTSLGHTDGLHSYHQLRGGSL